ncbi:MAG: type II toxin-antitoxin system VapC family toxin [Opitutales bacterium]
MEKRPTVYLETTIPSYLASRPSKDLVLAGEQLLTHEWWERRRTDFVLLVSEYVLDEAQRGDKEAAQRRLDFITSLKELEITQTSIELTQTIISLPFFPVKADVDAAHIALCCVHKVDFLLTWNCRHIANAQILRSLSKVIEQNGYSLPTICTPIELMEGGFNGR